MDAKPESRSERKRKDLLVAATELFLEKGYDSTSMDDVAAKAAVSKPTLYNHFSDKEHLFAEIVRSTTGEMDGLMRVVTETMGGQTNVESDLLTLARRFLAALMQPKILRLRRLVMSNADRFPNVGRSWYEEGFERALATLANALKRLGDEKLLDVDDPMLAAHHFVGMLLWIPVNRAMYTGDYSSNPKELDRYAVEAVRAFLAGYRQRNLLPTKLATKNAKKRRGN